MSQIPSICRKEEVNCELSEIRSPPRMSIRRMLKPGGSQISCAWGSPERLVEIQCSSTLADKEFQVQRYISSTFFLIYTEFLGTANQVYQQVFNKELGFMLDSQDILEISQEYSEVMYLNTLMIYHPCYTIIWCKK